ncbi:MAG: shikimate dehydrogenase [Pseudomonadota bacterium]
MTSPIPLAGVIGYPAAQSRSPHIHHHWLRRYGVPGHYIPLEIAPDDLPTVLEMMPRMGFVGANVTIPHKETVLRMCDLVTDRAALIGAVNTLIFREDGRIHGDNTDGYGFLASLRASVPSWQPKAGPAAVFGAGGASRAVIVAFLEAGVPEIRLTNRSRPRAEAMRSEFGARIKVVDWVKAGAMLEGAVTVVNATSLGMQGHQAYQFPLSQLEPGALVTDLVYTPLETEFLATARAAGCLTVDGLGMLLYQAVPGFERWFGQRPEVDDAVREAAFP